MPEPAPGGDQTSSGSEADVPAAALDALSPANLERVAGAVYRLLRNDLAHQRERRGASLGRWS